MLLRLILFVCPLVLSAYDWRFADPQSILIAGSAVPPTADPITYFFVSGWSPLSKLPPAFTAQLSKIQSVTYSNVSFREEVTVLTGTFDLAAIRSVAGNVGMTSQYYHQVEILAGVNPSRDQLALISSTTAVLGRGPVIRAAIDRFIADPTQSGTNALIQQSATFASGWDIFSIGSGTATMRAMLSEKALAHYLQTKAPVLQSQLSTATGFNFRARTINSLRAEINIVEPDTSTANSVASGITALLGQTTGKATGTPAVIAAVNSSMSIAAVGSIVELVIDPNLYTLTTAVTPPGSGTLSPSTTGVVFAANAIVTLNATPGACYTAPAWSANAPGGVVTMNAPQSVLATFPSTSAPSFLPSVTVLQGAIRKNNLTGRYQQVITLTNSGSTRSTVMFAFQGLTAGIALYNAAGTTSCAPQNLPYVNIATVPAGKSTITVEFTVTDPAIAIQYTPLVYQRSN